MKFIKSIVKSQKAKVAGVLLFLFTVHCSLIIVAQVAPPSGIIGWWPGDGDGNDISGNALNGTLFNSGYGVCKVGQCFDFSASTGAVPHLRVADNHALKPAQFTIEAWVKFIPTFDNYAVAIAKGYASGDRDSFALGTSPWVANPQFFTAHNGATHLLAAPTNLANPNSWNHLAASYDGITKRLYVNGILVASAVVNQPISYDSNPAPLTVGADWENGVPAYRFNGSVDETTLYNRALSDGEIAAIFNAGVGGKIKSIATSAGANSQSTVSDQTLTFENVSLAGTTSSFSIDPASAGSLPAGYTQTGLAYEISTTAVFNGIIFGCFHIASVNDESVFGRLKILHSEGGPLVDKTTAFDFPTRLVCGRVTSLSPFVIANGLTPTAAEVSVRGRVLTANGRGIRGAQLTLTARDGARRTVTTSTFGYYRFDDVEVGHTYVLEIASKRYAFADPARIFNLHDELTGIDFIALLQ